MDDVAAAETGPVDEPVVPPPPAVAAPGKSDCELDAPDELELFVEFPKEDARDEPEPLGAEYPDAAEKFGPASNQSVIAEKWPDSRSVRLAVGAARKPRPMPTNATRSIGTSANGDRRSPSTVGLCVGRPEAGEYERPSSMFTNSSAVANRAEGRFETARSTA